MARSQLHSTLERMVLDVLEEHNVKLERHDIEVIVRLLEGTRIPPASLKEAVRNAVAAYLRYVKGWSAREADKVAASSKGRRHWERKLHSLMASVFVRVTVEG